jgi:hypothetical protein
LTDNSSNYCGKPNNTPTIWGWFDALYHPTMVKLGMIYDTLSRKADRYGHISYHFINFAYIVAETHHHLMVYHIFFLLQFFVCVVFRRTRMAEMWRTVGPNSRSGAF